jgi:hypothetical protein
MDSPGPRHRYGDCVARERDRVAIALLLEIERPREAAATGGPSRSLAIASPDGRGVTPIAESIGGLLGHHQPNADSAFVFYVSDGAARVLDLDPTAKKVRSDLLLSAQE